MKNQRQKIVFGVCVEQQEICSHVVVHISSCAITQCSVCRLASSSMPSKRKYAT